MHSSIKLALGEYVGNIYVQGTMTTVGFYLHVNHELLASTTIDVGD